MANQWDADMKGRDVELLNNKTVAICNRGSGMGMSGVLGKDCLDLAQQPTHSVSFEVLKTSKYFALGVADASVMLDQYNDDGNQIVIRSTGEIRAYGKSIIPVCNQAPIQEGDTLRIDVDFPAKEITFILNGAEISRIRRQSQTALFPFFSACLGASVNLITSQVRHMHFTCSRRLRNDQRLNAGAAHTKAEERRRAPRRPRPRRARRRRRRRRCTAGGVRVCVTGDSLPP